MYRPDIDGLRALAVLPVVLFHAGFPGFYGGYVGVDVFFVISGYLITLIISKNLNGGDFSLAEFYHRRIRRIFPALFFMMFCVSALSAWVMMPVELEKFGKSIVATTLFSSNILYYFEAGYFTGNAHAKPLLHTWSLAVEEQFYLFWPLVAVWLIGKRRGHKFIFASTVIFFSLGLSIFAAKTDASAGFYIVITRVWELMIGAMLVVLPMKAVNNKLLQELIPLAGILMILMAVATFTESTPFPSYYALLPSLGAAAIIYGGTQSSNTVAARILSYKHIVFIGKISFSLYLWHWPVMVFAKIWLYQENTKISGAVEVVLSLVLAFFSWKFIEQPFRTGAPHLKTPTVLRCGGLVMSVFIMVGALLVWKNGFPERFNADQLKVASYESYDGDARYRGGRCFIVGGQGVYDHEGCLTKKEGIQKSILLLGDSHGAHLWPGLNAVYGDRINILQANETGCRPTISVISKNEPHCRLFFRYMLNDWLKLNKIDTLILAGRWVESDMVALVNTIQQVKGNVKNIVVVGPVPQYASDLPRLLVNSRNDPAIIKNALAKKPVALDKKMSVAIADAGATYFSVIDKLCDDMICRVYAQPAVPMQFDYGHFTEEGSRVVAEMMALDL